MEGEIDTDYQVGYAPAVIDVMSLRYLDDLTPSISQNGRYSYVNILTRDYNEFDMNWVKFTGQFGIHHEVVNITYSDPAGDNETECLTTADIYGFIGK